MSVPRTSSSAIQLSRNDRGDLTSVTERLDGNVIAYYVVNDNVLEKWSVERNKSARIEFAAPISLRYVAQGNMYTVNACAAGGLLPPPVVKSLESEGGLFRFFRIGPDRISDWMARLSGNSTPCSI